MQAQLHMDKAEDALRSVEEWRHGPRTPGDLFRDQTWMVELRALRELGRTGEALKVVEQRLPAYEQASFDCHEHVCVGWKRMSRIFFHSYLGFLTAEMLALCLFIERSAALRRRSTRRATILAQRILIEGRGFMRWYPCCRTHSDGCTTERKRSHGT
jgi:hypothetical protein